jgi:hypothetical protein
MMFEAVRVVATGELTAATTFAHEIVATATSGDWLELAEQLRVPLPPHASEADASTAQKLAWLRSDSAEAMLKLVETRLRQMIARNLPGGTRRDGKQRSPVRAKQRTEPATAPPAASPSDERR